MKVHVNNFYFNFFSTHSNYHPLDAGCSMVKFKKIAACSLIAFSVLMLQLLSMNGTGKTFYLDSRGTSESGFLNCNIDVDPALEKALRDAEGIKVIDCWFLFHDASAKTCWVNEHPSIAHEDHDLVAGIYFSEPASCIIELLRDDCGRCIKSAWLEQQIDTKDAFQGSVPRPSISPSVFGNIASFRNSSHVDGRGTIIGILSTGIGMHPDLKWVYDERNGTAVAPKVIANVSLVDWDPLYVDINGEGTYLAGVIAGTGNASNGAYTGVAPGAQLINAKCVDLIGITLWHWAVSAIEFCFSHGADIIVAGWNILGFPGDPLTTAVDEITKKGVTVVSASGDIGPSYMTVNTPGMASSSICAGGADTTVSPVRLANFTGRGPTIELVSKPDVLAPAVNITSCLPLLNLTGLGSFSSLPLNITSSYGVPLPSNRNYTTTNSTAAAAAYVAGACALLLQGHQFARPETLKDAIVTTATSLGFDANVQGKGIINVPAAWQYLDEHNSSISPNRTFTPAMPYAGFVPNFEILGAVNTTALWFVSSYGSMNFFTYLLQNTTNVGNQRNITNLLQGMFGLYHDGQFGFLLLDKVYREMHITHFGTYSRAVGVLGHDDKLLVVITAETWIRSLISMRLRFDIINKGNSPVANLSLHSWMKADLDYQNNILGMAKDDTGGYLAGDDMLYVNDTSRGSQNSSFLMFKANRTSTARAVGGLTDTISWVQNDSLVFNGNPAGDPVDNVTLASKYSLASTLPGNSSVSISFSVACGFDFAATRNATNYTIAGFAEPEIHDIVVVSADIERMYQVDEVIT
nr:S8 family serine peptidase [Candidatus Sigynarchaeota archaeon]